MKRSVLAVGAVLALAFTSQALAQSATVQIDPAQRTKIKEYVVKEKVKPVTIKEQVTVGTALPAGVEFLPVPTAWGPTLTKYNYVYHDNHVVLVEPESRKVVQIID